MRPLVLFAVAALLSAGEALLPPEAVAALSAQAKAAGTVETGPCVIGAWIWSGRADAQYKPFFEWDLRLAAGSQAVSGLKLRIATLGPKQEILREGVWSDPIDLAAGSTRDLGLRLNCPTFGAWRLDLAWKGGTETCLGTDKQGVPTALGDISAVPLLLAVNAQSEPDKAKNSVLVTWNLWNLGGAPATGVVQTVKVKDDNGKVVGSGELKMDKTPVPPRSSRECRLVLGKVPSYASLSVDVRNDDASTGKGQVLKPPTSSGPDLVVEQLRLADGAMTASLVNRFGKALTQVVVEVTFSSKGKAVKTFALPVDSLDDGASTTATVQTGPLPAWDEYSITWRKLPPATTAKKTDGIQTELPPE